MADANQSPESPRPSILPESAPPIFPSAPLPVPVFDFTSLAGQGNEVLIRLGTECYRLRLTRNGRLILNK